MSAAKKNNGKRKIDGLLLDVERVSKIFGPSDRAVRALVARQKIPFRKLGGRIVFIRSELEEFFSSLPGVSLEEIKKKDA